MTELRPRHGAPQTSRLPAPQGTRGGLAGRKTRSRRIDTPLAMLILALTLALPLSGCGQGVQVQAKGQSVTSIGVGSR